MRTFLGSESGTFIWGVASSTLTIVESEYEMFATADWRLVEEIDSNQVIPISCREVTVYYIRNAKIYLYENAGQRIFNRY